MKSNRKYIGFAASSIALLWLAGHGIYPSKNPTPGVDTYVVEETATKNKTWRKFFQRQDVILASAWFFAFGGTTQLTLPSDFSTDNTVYCIGCGGTGTTAVLSGPTLTVGPGGAGGAFVGSGANLSGASYSLKGAGTQVSVQVGNPGQDGVNTIFDASNNWIIARAGNVGTPGTASSSTGPSGCVKSDGGSPGAAIGHSNAADNFGPSGGGAGGPHGAGLSGTNNASLNTGGAADNNTSGRTTQFNGLYGPGDGGNGGTPSPSTVNGIPGGNYGGGGGAGGSSTTGGGPPIVYGTGAIGGGGFIGVSYTPIVLNIALSGSGFLSVTGSLDQNISSSFSPQGSFIDSATEIFSTNPSSFSGNGFLRVDAIFQGKWPGSANFLGNGGLTIPSFLPTQAGSSLQGSGNLQAQTPTAFVAGISTLSGGSSLTATALVYPVLNNSPSQTGWVPHDAASYAQGLNDLLPRGGAWPREPDHVLQKFVTGVAQIWGINFDVEAAQLLTQESDPRLTTMLLPDWERNWGLPDPCLTPPSTFSERRKLLVSKMTELGGQSRPFFISLAKSLGYTVTVKEHSPFMCGISRCGDTTDLNAEAGDSPFYPRWEIGPPEIRYYWSLTVSSVKLTWFRASSGQAGVDPHLKIGVPDDLVCIMRRYGPAHGVLVFDFAGSGGISSPLQGTP